jgi:hypothetical protein
VEARTREELINLIEENFEFEVDLLLEISPELSTATDRRGTGGRREYGESRSAATGISIHEGCERESLVS